MLNINQNFDLKAPVFNFDRDYFNSVEELKAYDTNNVPDHFVTNVGGMLYQFTKPWQWKPIIGTGDAGPDKHDINLGCTNAKINIVDGFPRYMSLEDEDGSVIRLMPGILDIYGITNHQNITIDADGNETGGTISIYGNDSTETRIASNIISCGDRRSFNVCVYGDEGRVEAQKKDGSFTSYGSNGFSGQTKDETKSYSLNIPSDNDENGEVSLSLKNADCSTKLSTDSGLTVTSDEGFTTNINNQSFSIQVFNTPAVTLDANTLLFSNTNNTTALKLNASNGLILGNDDKVKFSRPTNTEGAVISGIKSLTAFANPSATKVWATDGSTANLPTKFSDLTNDSIYIKGNKGETDSRFKIDYNDGDILRSRLIYKPRTESVGISELAMLAYDTSGTALSQIRIRPDNNADDGQYVIQIQDIKGGKQINRVSSLYPNGFSHQNFVDNTTVRLNSNELSFGPGANDNNFQAQLKINKDGITKTNGKATEVFAANGSIIDLTTYTNYFNGTTTADKLKSKAVEVTDDTNSVTVSPTGITATNGNTEGSIKMLTNKELTEEEQANGYSQVDISLTDSNNSASINPGHGFTYTNQNLRTSVNSEGLTVETLDLTTEGSGIMSITHNSINATEPAGSARLAILPNKINITGAYENTLTIEAPYSSDDYSEISLRREPDTETTINAEDGFIQTGPVCTGFGECQTQLVQLNRANIHFYKKDQSKQQTNAKLGFNKLENFLLLGNDQKFKISRPVDDTEGSTITGIKSIVAFSDPSNTKVFATDGSIVDLSTKANTSDLDAKANKSDVLLKKSTTGGYYIEENGNVLGSKAFATNSDCTASGNYSHAEGVGTAVGYSSHAEGISTASGNYAHSEGGHTRARGINSHSEGDYTIAGGFCSHAQGIYNIDSVNAIHSVGIGDATTRKNAEYIYAKNNTNGTAIVDDPKNGYKYLIGVGGYDGISTDNTTYKSVQEVIADLTARIEQLETKVKALEAANTPA